MHRDLDFSLALYERCAVRGGDGLAFVCHQTAPEIKASRNLLRAWHGKGGAVADRGPFPAAASPWRASTLKSSSRGSSAATRLPRTF